MSGAEFRRPGFKRAREATRAGAHDGLVLGTEHVLQVSQTRNPFEEGTLERSGAASTDGLRGAITYDTPYAVVQHEDLSLHHKGKGEAKYLESSGNSERPTVRAIIAAQIRKRLGT